MEKVNIQKRELIKKLKPFWREYWKISSDFNNKRNELEKKMNKKVNLDIDLEFFYCDGECCGIGAGNFSDREKFPLIHDTELFD